MKISIICLIVLIFMASLLPAADPPERINYQGVLRDASDKPINGNVAMKFRFYNDPAAGTLLWEEVYDAIVYPPEITISNGLFTKALGDPAHRNAGSIMSFPDIFKNYSDVYLAVVAGTDQEMTPRIKVISSAYALNAEHLSGKSAGEFLDTSSTPQTKSAKLTLDASAAVSGYGVEGRGPDAGGYFKDSNESGYAYVGYGDDGIRGYGNNAGGDFKDNDQSGQAWVGYGDYGIYARGNLTGGFFQDLNQSGQAYIGYEDRGVNAGGYYTGGYFYDSDSSGYAYAGYGDYGISAHGNVTGGFFEDINQSGYAWVGYGDYGILAYGNTMGGYFEDSDNTGYANVGYGNEGIEAFGVWRGGYFKDSDGSGSASVGIGDYGIMGLGNEMGGYFDDSDSSGLAYLGYGDRGIWGKGTFAGATFSHPDDLTFWADISTSTRKIAGTGTVSFVQNHPYDKSKVITYAAPEGDEVAVYTRGTSRLVNGEAVVKLGESFPWVANQDIGLTAHITPRGEQVVLSVDSLSTSEMIVRGPAGSNAAFDYIVFGLRIGFEELAVVQAKEREAFLPASEAVQGPYAQNPELRAFNALERFNRMRQGIGETGEINLTRSRALASAIDENKETVLAQAREQMEMERKRHQRSEVKQEPRQEADQAPMHEALEGVQLPYLGSAALIDQPERTVSGTIPVDEEGNIHARSFRSSSTDLTRNLPVNEDVQTGDLLVVDPLYPGMMKPAERASDPAVVGIVAGEPGVILGQEQPETRPEQKMVAVVLSGIVPCRVDASYGAIQIGDLLTTSATRGHAMKSSDHAPGTIIGKALEPLEEGTGLIKVLVMMR